MVDFDDLLGRWQAADLAACEAECAASLALDRHVRGLDSAPGAALLAQARQKRLAAQQALAAVYAALRETRCALPLL